MTLSLCNLASDGELDGIKAMQAALSPNEFRRQLFSKDNLLQTPLALATRHGHVDVVEYLLDCGAVESIFVHGSVPEKIRCTLPFSRISPELCHSSDIGAQITASLLVTVPEIQQDIVDLLDKHMTNLVDSLQQFKSSAKDDSQLLAMQVNTKTMPNFVKQPPQVPELFVIGDRVRLRPNLKYRESRQDMSWDNTKLGSMVTLSESNRTATRKGGSSYGCVLGSQSICKGMPASSFAFRFDLLGSERLYVGLAYEDVSLDDSCNSENLVVRSCGSLVEFGNWKKGTSAGALRQGDTLEVLVDMSLGQATFYFNGKETFKGKGIDRPVRAFAALGPSDFSITLVEPKHGPCPLRSALAHACLGDSEDCREGVVRSCPAGRAGQAPPSFGVASIHSGNVCDYSVDELAFADGSLPGGGPDPRGPLKGRVREPFAGTVSSKIPEDWGAGFIESVKVSTDSNGKGAASLTDELKTTYWRSSGRPGSHHIEVHLSKAMRLEELGIIIDGSEDSYCPETVRILAGDSTSTLTDLGVRSLNPGAGLHYACLLKDSGIVSVVRVCIESTDGGVNCKVYGVCVKPGRRSASDSRVFRVGDRVVLSDAYIGEGWNLKDGKIGVAICIPHCGAEEQRGVIVAALDDPSYCCCFRSSWLQHADREADFRFKIGDLVQLDVSKAAADPAARALLVSKCLGSPTAMRYGIVVDEGVVRDNVQRNIEVVSTGDSLDLYKQGSSGAVYRRSLYCSRVLQPAAASSVLTHQDEKAMIRAVQRLMEACGFEVNVETLVQREWVNAWSKVWEVSTRKVGRETVTTEFYRWQSSRSRVLMDPAYEDILDIAVAKPKSDASSSPAAVLMESATPLTWSCDCGFKANPKGKSRCVMCSKRGQPWTCNACDASNKVFSAVCQTCHAPRRSAKRAEADCATADPALVPAEASTLGSDSSPRWIRPSGPQIYKCYALPTRDSQDLGELPGEMAAGFLAMPRETSWFELEGGGKYVEVTLTEDVYPVNSSSAGFWVCARASCAWLRPTSGPALEAKERATTVDDAEKQNQQQDSTTATFRVNEKVLRINQDGTLDLSVRSSVDPSKVRKTQHGAAEKGIEAVSGDDAVGTVPETVKVDTTLTLPIQVNSESTAPAAPCTTSCELDASNPLSADFESAGQAASRDARESDSARQDNLIGSCSVAVKADKMISESSSSNEERSAGTSDPAVHPSAKSEIDTANIPSQSQSANAPQTESTETKISRQSEYKAVVDAGTARVGSKVMRGPDWKWGDDDGSPPSVGTLIAGIDSAGSVEVKWNCGKVMKCRAGEEESFDLVLAFDYGDVIEVEWSLDFDGGWLKIKDQNYFLKISDLASGISNFGKLKRENILDHWQDWKSSVEMEGVLFQSHFNPQGPLSEKSSSSGDSDDGEDSELLARIDPSLERVQTTFFSDLFRDKSANGKTGDMLVPPPLKRDASASFYGISHFKPIADIAGLAGWTDHGGNTAAHHTAFMGMHRSLQALVQVGASLWTKNYLGETPAFLEDGLAGAATLTKVALHEAIRKGKFFDNLHPDHLCRLLIRKAITTEDKYPVPQEFEAVKTAIADGRAVDAVQILNVSQNIHAGVYRALAMAKAEFGRKAVEMQLRKYLLSLARSDKDQLDPVYFYAHYCHWMADGCPSRGRLSAAYAISALRCFDVVSKAWLGADDSVAMNILGTSAFEEVSVNDEDSEDETETPGPEDPETEWKLAKFHHRLTSKSMDKLMSLTGLKLVKKAAMGIVKQLILRKLQPAGSHAEIGMNFLFLGNPGCGKTTVGRLLAGAMAELKFRSNPNLQEASAQAILKLKPDPVDCFVKMVDAAKGGTLFIDEAYRFSPSKGTSGPNASNSILDHLLEISEDDSFRKTTTIILAGYKDEIETLLTYNVGFSSRFSCEFNFPDYTESQLKSILLYMVKERGFRFQTRKECGASISTILARRMQRESGKKGFANARAVRNKVEEVIANQRQRLGSLALLDKAIADLDYQVLTLADTVGLRPDFSTSSVMKEVNSLVGLSKVKVAFAKLVDLQTQNYDREIVGGYAERISLHRVFYGNPGTGKTTVSRLYGALLKELGMLSKGDFIQCTPADLTGDAEGGAASNTKAMLERAKGKVLFIDEAYVLDPNRKSNQYGGNVLDTLVEKLEGEAGSDIAVILAGYKQEMFDLLENNPGLRRRFNMDDFGIHFEDMSDAELRLVLNRMVGKAGLALEEGVADFVVHSLSQKRRLPHFGNAGTVGSMLNIAKGNKSARLAKAHKSLQEAQRHGIMPLPSVPDPDILLKCDFVVDSELSMDKGKVAFSNLFNLDHIQSEISRLQAVIAGALAAGEDPVEILEDCHMVFTGPPGTGKTTVAMRFGQLFKNFGLLPTSTVIVRSGTSLQGQYVGETKMKVLKAMQEARGGILFIDECYTLDPGENKHSYVREAIDTLVALMTDQDFKGNMLVILAGYTEQVERLFTNANPGFKSRFDKRRIKFPPWSGDQAAEATIDYFVQKGSIISEEAIDALHWCYSKMALHSNWASARSVFEIIIPSMRISRAVRIDKLEGLGQVTDPSAPGVPGAYVDALESRRKVASIAFEVTDVVCAFEPIVGRLDFDWRVEEISIATNFRARMEKAQASKQLLVVLIYSESCGPCKSFAPFFMALRAQFPQVLFAKVAKDYAPEVMQGSSGPVTDFPTVIFFSNGAELERVTPAQINDLSPSNLDSENKKSDTDSSSNKTSSRPKEVNAKELPTDPPGLWQQRENVGAGAPSDHAGCCPLQGPTKSKARILTRHNHKQAHCGGEDGAEGSGAADIWAALEAACSELGYSLAQLNEMLQPGREYPKELLDLVQAKSGCHDSGVVISMLDRQRVQFLGKVQVLLKQRQEAQSEEEKAIQSRIKAMGRCPMDFEWLREGAGWRCAGGSHYISDEDMQIASNSC